MKNDNEILWIVLSLLIPLIGFIILIKKLWGFEPLGGFWKFLLVLEYIGCALVIVASLVAWSDLSVLSILVAIIQLVAFIFLQSRYNKGNRVQAPYGVQMNYQPPAPQYQSPAAPAPSQQYQSPDAGALIAACNRVGIPTANRSTQDIANDVIMNAPQETLSRLNPNMSLEQQALAILSGRI